MSNSTVTALSKEKHIAIIALLTIAGSTLTGLLNVGLIPQGIAAAAGALIGELLIYEHSA